jgi:hypothetical protein
VLRILPFFLLLGCATLHNPKPFDAKLPPSEKNWRPIYEHELKVAIENDDIEAWSFFWPEYLKELGRDL